MIVVVSPQLIEPEQKKRRQTLERAKANHLSKQLQMRLQYAKLKVEHGWQRQNLNEVENLYFHHSHLRSSKQSAGQRPSHVAVAYPPTPPSAPLPAEIHTVRSPPLSGMPDRAVGPSPSAIDTSSSGSLSPPLRSRAEHPLTADDCPSSGPSSQSQPYPPVQALPPIVPRSTSTVRPPSASDPHDPTMLARLAQLQAQVQIPPQSLSSQPTTTILPSNPISLPAPPHVQLSQPAISPPQPGFAFPAYTPHSPFGLLTPGFVSIPMPIYPVPTTQPSSTPHNNTTPSPPSVLASTSAPIPAAPTPTPAPIAPTALTYDSFWSTHASSTGPTRALYRTHAGFTASATPGGNVAMLTPGGHAAVMTAEGVYVGGAGSRNG